MVNDRLATYLSSRLLSRAQEEGSATPQVPATASATMEQAGNSTSQIELTEHTSDDIYADHTPHTGTIEIDEEINNYDEHLTSNDGAAPTSVAQSVLQARPGLLSKASDSLKTLWENHFLALFCVREKILKDEEIEKVSTNLKLLSSRYENPVLTALLKQRKRQLQQDREQQAATATSVQHDGNAHAHSNSFDEHSPTAY